MGVRLDTNGETNEDVLDDARLARDPVEALDFGHRVQNDVAYTGFHGGGQLGDRFVVAVQSNPLRRKVCVQRDGQLPAGAHVERQAFFVDPARYLAAQEGFSGVVDIGAAAECRRDLSAARAKVVFVDDEQRSAVLLG